MNELKWDEAQSAAIRTEPPSHGYQLAASRISSPEMMRLLHAAMGLCTEAGEIQDQLKKYIFYGKPLDKVNLFEEGGDISWYLRILSEGLKELTSGKCSFEEMIAANIRKLKIRFPDKFTEDLAINRDTKKEMEGLL